MRAALLALAVLLAVPPQDDALTRIRREGLERSKVFELFSTLTDQFGPRLAGTPAYKQSAEWARDRLREFGLAGAALEPWPFGRGWVLDRLVVEMVEPRYMPLIGYAEAWSAPTRGAIVATPVFLGSRTAAEIAAMKDRLKGAIVMVAPQTQFTREDRPQPSLADGPVRIGQPPWVTPRPSQADARAITQTVRDAGAAVQIRTSEGEHGTVFVLGRDQGENALPSVVLAGEHYNMIARMLARGIPVKLRVDVQARFLTDDPNSYNVVGDIAGADPQLKSEVVMIGAHLDSWHTGTGATDNADGAAVVLEAARMLKAIGLPAKRTIRAALWGGEEEGLLGSKAYVAAHYAGDANKEARDKLFAYLNLDPASGPIYGWYMEKSAPAKTLFDAWLEPLKDLGVRKNVIEGIGNTDHLSFRAAGIPGFNPIQEYKDYDVRTHHTNVDLYERVREQDLKQNAVVLAWFAWQAANAAERIPRP
ncbi:MAG TPA: M20/M25/M40 family metallo-hydrolase [Vicinamibacterales bacterium]|nr:M20/M25/M40 family metallo-hydrolase [Vicinamibacterales bacterium]